MLARALSNSTMRWSSSSIFSRRGWSGSSGMRGVYQICRVLPAPFLAGLRAALRALSQLKCRMHGSQCFFAIFLGDEARDADFAGGDVLNVHLLMGQRA